jgi:hypothetical protein
LHERLRDGPFLANHRRHYAMNTGGQIRAAARMPADTESIETSGSGDHSSQACCVQQTLHARAPQKVQEFAQQLVADVLQAAPFGLVKRAESQQPKLRHTNQAGRAVSMHLLSVWSVQQEAV